MRLLKCKNKVYSCVIDAEHAIDPVYAKNLGVNIDELILSQPDSGEQGLEIAETLVRSGAIDLVVVDSVAALVPQVELDGEMADQQMGLQARLMSKALRKLSGVIIKQIVQLFSLTNYVKKLVLCLEIRRRRPVAVHLSFILLSVWTCAV